MIFGISADLKSDIFITRNVTAFFNLVEYENVLSIAYFCDLGRDGRQIDFLTLRFHFFYVELHMCRI